MKTVIIGAGLAGLSAAHILKENCTVLEKEARPGGLARTEIRDGFTFDYTGHLLHLRDPKIEKFILDNVKTQLLKIKREAVIFSNNVYTAYPYQVNSYGLPAEIIEENLTGFIRAKLKKEAYKPNFRDWVNKTFGSGIANNFMLPYNEKFWKYPLDKLTLEWLGRFVPDPKLEDVIEGVKPKPKDAGYNVHFYYPERGGIERVVEGVYGGVANLVRSSTNVTEIDLVNRIVYFEGGQEKYDALISTIPLDKFLKMTAFPKLKYLASKLRATSVYALNVGFKSKEKITRHWVYVPEKKYPFYRIGFPHTFAPSNAPEGMSSVFAEVSYSGSRPSNPDAQIIKGLIDMGVIGSKKDIVTTLPMNLESAYVVYNKDREEALPQINEILAKHNVHLAGRWGKWEYSSMEDAIMEGFEVGEKIRGQ